MYLNGPAFMGTWFMDPDRIWSSARELSDIQWLALLHGAILAGDARLEDQCRSKVELPITAVFAACMTRGDWQGAFNVTRMARFALGRALVEKFFGMAAVTALRNNYTLFRCMLRAWKRLLILEPCYTVFAAVAMEYGSLRALRMLLVRRGVTVNAGVAHALMLRVRALPLRRSFASESLIALGGYGREHAVAECLVYAMAAGALPTEWISAEQRPSLTREAFWGVELWGSRCAPHCLAPSAAPAFARRVICRLSFSASCASSDRPSFAIDTLDR